MSQVDIVFERIEKIIKIENSSEFMTAVFKHILVSKGEENEDHNNSYQVLNKILKDIIQEIDSLAIQIKRNDSVLISVKHQKVLRTCYQIISSFGITMCLLPGLGICLSKRCISAQSLPQLVLSDEQKYEILVMCTDFLNSSYDVPVLKNIIITFHMVYYLAALIQLAFAPLKKPGIYSNFTMTQEIYNKLEVDRQKYVQIYENLVSNCFQPMLMKELLVLQNVTDQKSPLFVKRVIAKEMSRRLTVSGGLLSLIRCFIDSPDMDTGVEWKKIDMICKIISIKHGNMSENEYLKNITSQLKDIFSINNTKYLLTAISCLLTLYEKYGNVEDIQNLVNKMFRTLDYDILISKSCLPGTIILTPQEIEHNIQILHITSISQAHAPPELLSNLYILFLLRIKCTKSRMKLIITNIILKAFELIDKTEMCDLLKQLIFGPVKLKEGDILIEEYEAGLAVKYTNSHFKHPVDQAVLNFMEIFNATQKNKVISNLFEACLQIFVDINTVRLVKTHTEPLLSLDDEPILLNSDDEKYIHMLSILSEISTTEKVLYVLKTDPSMVINFVEAILLKDTDDECKTIALVLLNTILCNVNTCNLKEKLHNILPKLQILAENDSEYIKILCKESISLILSENSKGTESQFEEALSNIFDNLLPLRAHGIIKLSKLIEIADPETISKRHIVFCLLQDQLKNPDSYIYLSTINCIASLSLHCTSDALTILCKEYLTVSIEMNDLESRENQNAAAELRMKIGDVIVKVTRRLGEMAVVHKNILLNTVLCACRDDDPLLRASALSNLAEIALVLNYKIGSIIYEVLLCVWSIIETDKAIECRRAAVMVLSSFLKGLGKKMLVELKENLLPIYRTLNDLYKDSKEDSIVRLHAQMALEELNEVAKQFLLTELPMKRNISMLKESNDIIFK